MQYAGDISCKAVWASLEQDEKAALVDVRTTQEWATIGVPDLSSTNKQTIFAEWQMFPTMQVNPGFASMVDEQLQAAGLSKDDPVYFLCRSGVRSQGAASEMTALGYSKAYNILSGFEGPPDAKGQRGTVSGWQSDDLPWLKE
ncbi:MAG: rhodanese-like domain-containing protein [Salaquimonas sp.]